MSWPLRIATLSKGVPGSVTINGVTYTRLRFGNDFLDRLISSQPLYGV